MVSHFRSAVEASQIFPKGKQKCPARLYLGLAAGELAPDTLMAFERAIAGVCVMLRRRSPSQVSAPPRCASSAVPRHWIKLGPAKGLPRKQIAPAFSARARTLSSGKAVMKMNGAR
jgi:hypothetical protein